MFSQAGGGGTRLTFHQSDLSQIFAAVTTVDPDGTPNGNEFQAGLLADNGGPVQTIAINPAGAARDAGGDVAVPQTDPHDLNHNGVTNEPLPVDVRGAERVAGAHIDVGAVEFQATPTNLVFTTLDDVTDIGGDYCRRGRRRPRPVAARGALAAGEHGHVASHTIYLRSGPRGRHALPENNGELRLSNIAHRGRYRRRQQGNITISRQSRGRLRSTPTASTVFNASTTAQETARSAQRWTVWLSVTGLPTTAAASIWAPATRSSLRTRSSRTTALPLNGGEASPGRAWSQPHRDQLDMAVNTSEDSPGAINGYYGGFIGLFNSAVAGNSSTHFGGGISGDVDVPISLVNSTVSE